MPVYQPALSAALLEAIRHLLSFHRRHIGIVGATQLDCRGGHPVDFVNG